MSEQITYKSYHIQIRPDDFPENPRSMDTVGTMYFWSRRRQSPDDNPFEEPADFEQWATEHKEEIFIVRPVYLYGHSGLAYSHKPFSCPWDSGQAGYHWVSKEVAERDFDGDRDVVIRVMDADLELYAEYANGNVWEYYIEFPDGTEDWGGDAPAAGSGGGG